MIIFKYLDIPKIPEDIIPSRQEILELPYKDKTIVPNAFYWFRNKHTNKTLDEWIQDQFKIKLYTQFQLIYSGIPIHKDLNRLCCINYLLYPGGDSVSTNFYNKDKSVLDRVIIKEKIWHTFLTQINHDVTNIDENDIRIAIGCTPVDEKQYILNTFDYISHEISDKYYFERSTP